MAATSMRTAAPPSRWRETLRLVRSYTLLFLIALVFLYSFA